MTQAKARQEVEIGQAQNGVQNKRPRVIVEAGESPGKSGDQKSPFNLNDAIITSAMSSGLSNLNDRSILGEGPEVKILETQDSTGPPKTKVVSEGVLPGTQSSIDITTPVVGQIPPPAVINSSVIFRHPPVAQVLLRASLQKLILINLFQVLQLNLTWTIWPKRQWNAILWPLKPAMPPSSLRTV